MSAQLEEPGLAAGIGAGRTRRGGFVWKVIKERPSAAIGAGALVVFALIGIFAPALAPYGVHQQIGTAPGCVYAPPSPGHLLGLDDACHDMVSLLIYGIRVSMVIGLAATAVAMLIGGSIGIVSGFYGGGIDNGLMRVTDYFLVLPELVLMMIVAAIWGSHLINIIIIIGVILWAGTARIIRAQVKSVRERVYVRRAVSIGAANRRIIGRHILPQVMPLLIANTVLTVAVAIFEETAIAFLGLGDPSQVSLGRIIESAFQGNAVSNGAWWAIVPPGVLVAMIVLSCTLLGSGMEDALNPRLKVSHLSRKSFRLLPFTAKDEA
jgi:peptide/nickel transport system permease protein